MNVPRWKHSLFALLFPHFGGLEDVHSGDRKSVV